MFSVPIFITLEFTDRVLLPTIQFPPNLRILCFNLPLEARDSRLLLEIYHWILSIISGVLKLCDVSEDGSYSVVICKRERIIRSWELVSIAGYFVFCVLAISKWQNPKCFRRFCDNEWDRLYWKAVVHFVWHSNLARFQRSFVLNTRTCTSLFCLYV